MTTFTRVDQAFKVQSSAGAASADIKVSTDGRVEVGTLTMNALVLTSAMVSAAASAGVGATTSHYIKFTQGANTFYIPCNISAF